MGSCFESWKTGKRREKDTFSLSSKIDALAEDENDGSLRNGGDSDPAETTVGKLASCRVDSTRDLRNMSGRAIRAANFQSCNCTFWGKIRRERAAARTISPKLSHSRGRRDNPRTAHIQENRSDAPARSPASNLALQGPSRWLMGCFLAEPPSSGAPRPGSRCTLPAPRRS